MKLSKDYLEAQLKKQQQKSQKSYHIYKELEVQNDQDFKNSLLKKITIDDSPKRRLKHMQSF